MLIETATKIPCPKCGKGMIQQFRKTRRGKRKFIKYYCEHCTGQARHA